MLNCCSGGTLEVLRVWCWAYDNNKNTAQIQKIKKWPRNKRDLVMTEQQNSAQAGSISIDQKLIEEGTAQLTSEIEVLENWLAELESSGKDDAEVTAARKSYNDMLRSRREMLSTLAKQAKLQ